MQNQFDITIIGGSFAGMTAGLVLAGIDESLKIAIIEKNDIKKHDRQRDGRAYAISSSSLKILEEIGVAKKTDKEAGIISDIKITDHKSPFFLNFIGSEVDDKKGRLGQIIENYHIHNALRDRVLEQKNIKVFCPNVYEEIKPGNAGVSPAVKLDNGETLESKLILACDGRFSPLREFYQIPTAIKNYHQIAFVFNIEHEKPHQDIAHEKFFPGGPLAILPLKKANQSSIVFIVKEELAESFAQLDEENFLQQLEKKMDGELGKVKIISEKFSYPLIMIEAEKFYHEKLLFIGDAACGVHPIAGQGYNLGVAGIAILRDLIKENLFNGLPINAQNVIEAYDKKARFNARKMVIATDVLNSIFETKNLSLSILRDVGLGIIEKVPPLKKFFIKQAGGF